MSDELTSNDDTIQDWVDEITQVTGCTAGDTETYNAVEHAIECAIASEGPNAGPLGQSLILAETASQPPLSCMIDLVTGSDVDCGAEIPADKREAAFNAFTEVTNFQPINVGTIFSEITDEQRNILNLTAFYIFFPSFLFVLVAIWLMVGFNWFTWPAGLFLSVLTFIILYGFALLYRTQVYNFLLTQNQQWQEQAANIQSNFENSVAYWPQGLFAVACAVTATGGTGWTCNEVPDTGVNKPSNKVNTCVTCKPKNNKQKSAKRKRRE